MLAEMDLQRKLQKSYEAAAQRLIKEADNLAYKSRACWQSQMLLEEKSKKWKRKLEGQNQGVENL